MVRRWRKLIKIVILTLVWCIPRSWGARHFSSIFQVYKARLFWQNQSGLNSENEFKMTCDSHCNHMCKYVYLNTVCTSIIFQHTYFSTLIRKNFFFQQKKIIKLSSEHKSTLIRSTLQCIHITPHNVKLNGGGDDDEHYYNYNFDLSGKRLSYEPTHDFHSRD